MGTSGRDLLTVIIEEGRQVAKDFKKLEGMWGTNQYYKES